MVGSRTERRLAAGLIFTPLAWQLVLLLLVLVAASLGDHPSGRQSLSKEPRDLLPPIWLNRTTPLDSEFWDKVSQLQLPTHTRISQKKKLVNVDTCERREAIEHASSTYQFDVNTLHLAGDIEVIVLLAIHNDPSLSYIRPFVDSPERCKHVSGTKAWLQIELVRLLVQLVNSFNMFGTYTFGAEIVDTCGSVSRSQFQIEGYGKVDNIATCAHVCLNSSMYRQEYPACEGNGDAYHKSAENMDDGSSADSCIQHTCQKRGVRNIVLGPGSSAMSLHTAPFTSHSGLSQISFGATLPDLSRRSDFPDFFRTVSSDLVKAQAIAAVLEELEISHVALLEEDTVLGQELKHAFESHYTGCTAISADFTVDSNASLLAAFQRLNNANAVYTVVVLGSKEASSAVFATAREALQNLDRYVWIASDVNRMLITSWKLNILVLRPTLKSTDFIARAWQDIKNQIRKRIKGMDFKFRDFVLNPWLNEIAATVADTSQHIPRKCGQKMSDEFGLRSAFKRDVENQLQDIIFEDELKELARGLMIAARVPHSILHRIAETCKSSIEAGVDTEMDGPKNWCKHFPQLVLNETHRFTAPKLSTPNIQAIACSLNQQEVTDTLNSYNLTGDDPGQAAYDIIVVNVTQADNGRASAVSETMGHWELPSDNADKPSHSAIFYAHKKEWVHQSLSRRHVSSCSLQDCEAGTRLVVDVNTNKCCFHCDPCIASVSTGNNSAECNKCEHFTRPNLDQRGTECVKIETSISSWDQGWSFAMPIMSFVVVIVIVVATIWSLQQVETKHIAKKRPSLHRLSSSSVTSTDSVSSKPRKVRYVAFTLLLAGCLFSLTLPWAPSQTVCTVQQLTIPILTPLVTIAMMLMIINRHRRMFVNEFISWKKTNAAISAHHFMGDKLQAVVIVTCTAILLIIVVVPVVVGDNITFLQSGFKVHALCSPSSAATIVYFLFLWLAFAVLLAAALVSFIAAQRSGVIFSRPSAVVWASGALLFLWSLLLPAHFALAQVNSVTVVCFINNLHTLVVLAIACLADLRVVRRRQRTNTGLSFNLFCRSPSGDNVEPVTAITAAPPVSNGGSAYMHSQTTNMLSSPLSPSPHQTNNGANPKSPLFTFEKNPDTVVKVNSENANKDGQDRLSTCLLSRANSTLTPASPFCDDKVAFTNLSMFNTGDAITPDSVIADVTVSNKSTVL